MPRVPPVALYAVGDDVSGGAEPGMEVLGTTGFDTIGFDTMTGGLFPGKTSPVAEGIVPVTPGSCEVDAVDTMLDEDRGESTFTGV